MPKGALVSKLKLRTRSRSRSTNLDRESKCHPRIVSSKETNVFRSRRPKLIYCSTRSRSNYRFGRAQQLQLRSRSIPCRRKTVTKKYKCGRRMLKNTTPTYALSIVGKILYRRLKRNSLVDKGVNLVRKISSSSLFGWGGRMLKSAKDDSNNNNSTMLNKTDENIELLPVDGSFCAETVELNTNVNARTNSNTRQDLKQNISSRVGQAVKTSTFNSKKAKQKFRRMGRHRGLVARSMGKKRVRSLIRSDCSRKGKVMYRLGKKKKHRRQNVSLRSLRARVLSNLVTAESTTRTEDKDRSKSTVLPSLTNSLSGIQVLSKTELSKVKATEAPASQEEAPGTSKRKSRKWKTLLKLGNTVQAGHTSAQAPKKKRWERKMAEHTSREGQELPHSTSQSVSVSSEDEPKSMTPETSEWPSLAVSARTRAHAKDTATEIIMSRHNSAGGKAPRKGWADIPCKKNKDAAYASSTQQFKDKKKTDAEPGQEKKTWASVAAAGTSKCELITRKNSVNKQEQCVEPSSAIVPSGSGNLKKKKKKVDYSLAYTDRIWLTCQQSKKNALAENVYRKHRNDRKDLKISKRKGEPPSPRKKMLLDKRRDKNKEEKQVNEDKTSLSQTLIKGNILPSTSTGPFGEGGGLECTSSDQDSQGENICLVDNMPVVYTKKAGMIITLNESNHDRSSYKNINKCNNKMNRAGNSKTLPRSRCRRKTGIADCSEVCSDVSGTDLCSQLSSMTFQTPTASCCALERDAPGSSGAKQALSLNGQSCSFGTCKVSSSNGQSNASKTTQLDGANTKAKKVSLRYRALLRDGDGPLDARAVSDIQTRHRRADSLHDNKLATRATRRRLRTEQQNTTRISRRCPPNNAEMADSNKPLQGGSAEKRGQLQQKGEFRSSTTRRSCSRKIPKTPQELGCEAGTSRCYDTGQVNSVSSSASSGMDGAGQPADSNGTNNSHLVCPHNDPGELNNPQFSNLRKSSHANVLGPAVASSAPQLSEHDSSIRLELRSNLHTLDMNW
ncbi:hypothetical protein EGW08_008951 [Elysia chlorotica]|uniref:Uncharacterized protein n=1 Tax=Elysia chlorotica TaxID=188477 RepID=A0A3S1BL37_ELYCH|nr:hypothetical protein EGW08_008951 [Elysia chlorotica]